MQDTFQFECTACGKCCFNNTVLINCYDLIRLRHGLKASTTQILQEGLVGLSIGPFSGLPVCTIKFQSLSKEFTKCPFLSPTIKKGKLKNIKSKSELKRVLELGAEIEKWLCSVHEDRPIACRLYPLGRVKNINQKTGKVKETFILQDTEKFCPGFKEKKKQTLTQYLKESKFKNYDEGSAKFASLMNKIIKSGFFVPTERNDKNRAKLKKESKVLFILGNIMYNFDSFNYFSEDKRVLKTINDPKATQKDFMYVFNKIDTLVFHLVKMYKKHGEDDEAIMKIINSIQTKGV